VHILQNDSVMAIVSRRLRPKQEIQATEIASARQYGTRRMQEKGQGGEDAGGGREWNPPDVRIIRLSAFGVLLL
jgi:hypothetical protein